jgi:hypothetical protein
MYPAFLAPATSWRPSLPAASGRASFCYEWLKQVHVNGKRKGFSFNLKDSLIKISTLGLNATTAPGATVCLAFVNWVDCNGPGWMCYPTDGSCKVAIFNKERDCCPVSYTGNRDVVDDYGDYNP